MVCSQAVCLLFSGVHACFYFSMSSAHQAERVGFCKDHKISNIRKINIHIHLLAFTSKLRNFSIIICFIFLRYYVAVVVVAHTHSINTSKLNCGGAGAVKYIKKIYTKLVQSSSVSQTQVVSRRKI